MNVTERKIGEGFALEQPAPPWGKGTRHGLKEPIGKHEICVVGGESRQENTAGRGEGRLLLQASILYRLTGRRELPWAHAIRNSILIGYRENILLCGWRQSICSFSEGVWRGPSLWEDVSGRMDWVSVSPLCPRQRASSVALEKRHWCFPSCFVVPVPAALLIVLASAETPQSGSVPGLSRFQAWETAGPG